jgi:hypothetical protein
VNNIHATSSCEQLTVSQPSDTDLQCFRHG